jgi:hypothetical protein
MYIGRKISAKSTIFCFQEFVIDFFDGVDHGVGGEFLGDGLEACLAEGLAEVWICN